MTTDPGTTSSHQAASGEAGAPNYEAGQAMPGRRARLYRAFTRTHPRSAERFGPITLAFATLTAVSIVVSILTEQPVALGALAPMLMMVVFGIGELSQRPAVVASSRVLGGAIFLSFWIVLPVAWATP